MHESSYWLIIVSCISFARKSISFGNINIIGKLFLPRNWTIWNNSVMYSLFALLISSVVAALIDFPIFIFLQKWHVCDHHIIQVVAIFFPELSLKLVSAIYKIFVFHQMIALQKLGKTFFVLEIFKFLHFRLPLFFSLSAIALEVDPRKILKFMMSSTV